MGCEDCDCKEFQQNSDPDKGNKCGRSTCGHSSQRHTKTSDAPGMS